MQTETQIRRRAVSNLMLILLDQSRRSAGRCSVQPFAPDALRLAYRDIRTLVGRGNRLEIACRDFEVLLVCPPLWPFDRAAPLIPYVCAPDDFRHPNGDGHALCIDLAGVVPELVPGLLYDNLRVSHFRLDHCVDLQAAAFVRDHLPDFPADARLLYAPAESPTRES